MIVGALTVDGVKIGEIKMPETHREIRYGQYLDFAMISNDTNEWLTKQIEEGRDYKNQYRVKLAKAAATIFDIDTEILLKLQYDGIEFLENAYTMINNLIVAFKPVDNAGKFEHQSTTYEIPEITKAIFRGTNNLPPFSFQQLTEIAESERILSDQIKKIDAQQKDENDFKGNVVTKAMQKSHHTFQNTMKKIVLCLTPAKEIPIDDSFDMWMETQMVKLKDISMDNALNVLFFLRSIPNGYGTLIGLNSILSDLKSRGTETKQANNTQNEYPIYKQDLSASAI